MPTVIFIEPDGAEYPIAVKSGTTARDAAVNNGVPGIDGDCGGECACATCHVYVDTDWMDKIPPREDMEEDMLDFAFEPDLSRSRLTCQLTVSDALDGLIVTMPERQI